MAGTEKLTLLSSGAFVMGIEFTLAMSLNIENTYLKKEKEKSCCISGSAFLQEKPGGSIAI